MKLTSTTIFEAINDEIAIVEYAKDRKQFPPFVVCDNEYCDNEIVVANVHWFDNPRNYSPTYDADVEFLGIWNVTYKKAS